MADKAAEPETLKHWLQKLESLNPSHIKLGLERSKTVLERMDISFSGKIITVAGTNGKGTSVALLEKLLRAEKCSVGAYTSPHIFHFRERIRIDAVPASDAQLVRAFEAVEIAREATELTYFEFATLAAAHLFSEANLDYWLMEVGLGGRLDAVNLFEPDVALVTNIGLDHTDWLGDTLELIAEEKAGIFRKGKPAIFTSTNRPNTIDTTVDKVQAKGLFAGRDFGLSQGAFWWLDKNIEKQKYSEPLPISLSFSPEILAAVLAALNCLGHKPALENLNELKSFELPGRFQQLQLGDMTLIVDVAHNQDSAMMLGSRIEQLGVAGLTAVIGIMNDKSAKDLIRPMINHVDNWIVVRPQVDRAANLSDVEQALRELDVASDRIQRCEDTSSIKSYLANADTAVIYGSFYTVGECLSAMGVDFE